MLSGAVYGWSRVGGFLSRKAREIADTGPVILTCLFWLRMILSMAP
ncbi:hypothetical protein HY373_00985 [Candidatus Berkelbacteria bacterium]|nr:hypothetical protein [Candidatus Berkelbacteria bacterium]